MTLKTKRAKEIDTYIRDHPDAKSDYERPPVQLAGKIHYLDVYTLPLELLIYNIRNGRFAAELIARERELERHLDANDEEDARIIQELLLEQSPTETRNLKADLTKNGQLDPGIITFDGAVINANRRKAILTLLHSETGDDKHAYLRVGRLPESVQEKDLWRIEAGLQFAHDFRLKYGPINELLKLREGKRQGLSDKEIESSLMGRWSQKEIRERLEVLKLIDNYLVYIGRPEQYDEVESSVEKFYSLHNNVIRPLARKGLSKSEQLKMTMVAYNLIRLTGKKKLSHWKIRDLKEIALLDRAKTEIMVAQDTRKPEATDLDKLREAFETASEIVKAEKSRENPERLLRDALSAVESIDLKSPRLKTSKARALLADLDKLVAKLKSRVGGA